jgi:hypothetical protein
VSGEGGAGNGDQCCRVNLAQVVIAQCWQRLLNIGSTELNCVRYLFIFSLSRNRRLMSNAVAFRDAKRLGAVL